MSRQEKNRLILSFYYTDYNYLICVSIVQIYIINNIPQKTNTMITLINLIFINWWSCSLYSINMNIDDNNINNKYTICMIMYSSNYIIRLLDIVLLITSIHV